jgi:BirA family biotin operon repressor/biotin-[acetyl-CoA-carboxylase] ligase
LGKSLNINALVAILVGEGHRAYRQYCDGGIEECFMSRWEAYDVLKDAPVVVNPKSDSLYGTAGGINADGALILHTEDGCSQVLHSGEVTLRVR